MAQEDVAPGEILLSVPLDSVFSDLEVSPDCFDLILRSPILVPQACRTVEHRLNEAA